MQTEIENGMTIIFWCDQWLNGQRIVDITPQLYDVVPKRIANKRTVREALTARAWVREGPWAPCNRIHCGIPPIMGPLVDT
jgi:hypothetical protein